MIVEHVDGAFGDAMPFGRQKARPGVDAGIGEDHVDPPMPLRHGVESRGHPGAIGDVHDLAPDLGAVGAAISATTASRPFASMSKMQTRAPLSAMTSA